MTFRYLEDIAKADAAFEAEGGTLEELFKDAAIATFEVSTGFQSLYILKMRKVFSSANLR